MLAALVPLFDETMSVTAYSLFSQKENMLLEPRFFVSSRLDGAGYIPGLEIIESMGMSTISSDHDIFVPVNNVSLFADIDSQCATSKEHIVLIIDSTVKPTKMYIDRVAFLKERGYRFAVWKLAISDFELYRPILNNVDYIFLNHKKIDIEKAKLYFSKIYPNIKLIAGNIQSQDEFEMLKADTGYNVFEGPFYRIPVNKGDSEVSPLKVNYLQLLNICNDDNFDLTDAADVIGRDTALVIELLSIVNKISRNSKITTIRHAAAMLGQRELRRWITTVATTQLCSDKPNEINRLSLLRARFIENLAPYFNLEDQGQELFLLGLFSVLDIILEKPMSEVFDMIKVSDIIKDALVRGEGKYAVIYDFILQYEQANWQEVSRQALLNNIELDDIYKAYSESLSWYRDLFFENNK